MYYAPLEYLHLSLMMRQVLERALEIRMVNFFKVMDLNPKIYHHTVTK